MIQTVTIFRLPGFRHPLRCQSSPVYLESASRRCPGGGLIPRRAPMDVPGTIPRPLVVPAPGSRLEQLLDLQAAAEAAVADAERTLEEINTGIKAETATE